MADRLALVVDDDPAVGDLMGMILESRGWKAIVASDPVEAAALAKEQAIDLLLTDLQMPAMTGLRLAATLRKRNAALPVVIMSGQPASSAIEVPPPYAFLRKPFGALTLLEAIAELMPVAPTANRRVFDHRQRFGF
jgi:two-component system, cell cycle sensor histidine kinase and response regulator CckA